VWYDGEVKLLGNRFKENLNNALDGKGVSSA
jgi:hypothetical protein